MKNQIRQNQPDHIKIEEIVYAFKNYAIRDIEVNIQNPIAAFILSTCLIDQLAAYRYNHGQKDNKDFYNKFIKEYLPQYAPLNLYKNLRCNLLHNYTISKYMSIAVENPVESKDSKTINLKTITITRLLSDLKIAFEKFAKELLSETDARKNALDRFKEAPIILGVTSRFWIYSETEASFLIKYYTPLVVGKLINHNSSLKIKSIYKEEFDSKYVLSCQTEINGHFYNEPLDAITQQLALKYPIDALKEAGIYEE